MADTTTVTVKKGDTFTDPNGNVGTVGFDSKTGAPLADGASTTIDNTNESNVQHTAPQSNSSTTGMLTDPTVSSDGYRASVDALSKNITAEQDRLKSEASADAYGINASYEEANRIQEERQGKDYAGNSTNLITAGGGFLGYTGSQQGVLQNLKNTFTQEKQALMAKRDAALRASKDAYDGKAFALAQQQLGLAKDAEAEIYNRQKDYAAQQLDIARENRTNDEYQRNLAKDKLDAFTEMTDEAFKKADPALIKSVDDLYYQGYTADHRAIEKKAAEAKSFAEQQKLDIDVLNVIRQIPSGQKVTIGGKTYVGMKPAASNASSLKGLVTPFEAQVNGLPSSLVGLPKETIIMSLERSQAPQWFVDYIEQTQKQSLTPDAVKRFWESYRTDPDIQPFVNSVRIDKANSISSGSDDLTAAIAALSADTGQ